MFTNLSHLNEGHSLKSALEEKKKLLNEGENPRTNLNNDFAVNKQESRAQTHVNHTWEKLRK